MVDHIDTTVTVWSKRLALALFGWFVSSAYHGTMDLNQKARTLQHVQAVDIPKLKAARDCEDRRADKSAAVAGRAILGANIDNAPVPKFKDIPEDRCPHVSVSGPK